MSPLESAIIKTLTWFDLMHQPLTTWEVWHYLWDEDSVLKPVSPDQVLVVLEKLASRGLAANYLGYWQLAATADYLPERLKRFKWTISRRRRAARAAGLIKHLPFVRLVALANTASYDMSKYDSDIDFFIVIKAGYIFTTRFLITALVQALGWRRHHKLISQRICLSFYLASDNLNLRPLAYADDPYLRFWLAGLYVLYDGGAFKELAAANSWVWREFPNWRRWLSQPPADVETVLPVRSGISSGIYAVPGGEISLSAQSSLVETIMAKWQMYLIRRHQNSRLGDGSTAVLADRRILKFHEGDTRLELAARFRRRLAEITV